MSTDLKLIASDGIARTRPLSVLVVSTDRRFRSVTSVLIARRGCAVATTESAADLAELAECVRPDVVVVDVDGGAPAGASARAQVEGHPRPPGLVLVDDDPAGIREPDGAQLIAKWGPFERLYEAIEAADADRVRTGGGDGGV